MEEGAMPRDRIAMLGDSLTEYNVWTSIDPEAEVINFGLSGDTTGGMKYRLGRVVLANPDLIILQAGINDLSQGREPSEIVEGHQTIWKSLSDKLPKLKILVCSLAPLNERMFGWPTATLRNARVLRTNELLCEAAKKAGWDWLDLYGPLSDESGSLPERFTDDGVHLTAPAYEVWVETLRKWLADRG
jgi:lysophospholipase L1-like esterase